MGLGAEFLKPQSLIYVVGGKKKFEFQGTDFTQAHANNFFKDNQSPGTQISDESNTLGRSSVTLIRNHSILLRGVSLNPRRQVMLSPYIRTIINNQTTHRKTSI